MRLVGVLGTLMEGRVRHMTSLAEFCGGETG